MTNAVDESCYRIMQKTANVNRGYQTPTAPCPRCGGKMIMQSTSDGRFNVFICSRCKLRSR